MTLHDTPSCAGKLQRWPSNSSWSPCISLAIRYDVYKRNHKTHDDHDTTDHQGLKSVDQSEISSVSSQRMSKLQRRQSGSFRKRSDMGRFSSLPSGVGSVQSESRYSAMSTRPYSPAPLIEFLPEIDFSDPLFIGDSATQMLPIHANVTMGFIPQSFIKVNLNFRSGKVSDIF